MIPPSPLGQWNTWAERLNAFLQRTRGVLRFLTSNDSAAEDGVMMWDREKGHMVLSVSGAFQPIPYGENSYGSFVDFTDQTASGADTATAITFNTSAYSHNVSIDGNAGDYLQSMFAVDSTSGSLSTTAATAFSPASPSVTLSVAELYVP